MTLRSEEWIFRNDQPVCADDHVMFVAIFSNMNPSLDISKFLCSHPLGIKYYDYVNQC